MRAMTLCSPRAGAAAHAGRDEHHMGAGNSRANVLDRLFRRRLADLGLGTGARGPPSD